MFKKINNQGFSLLIIPMIIGASLLISSGGYFGFKKLQVSKRNNQVTIPQNIVEKNDRADLPKLPKLPKITKTATEAVSTTKLPSLKLSDFDSELNVQKPQLPIPQPVLCQDFSAYSTYIDSGRIEQNIINDNINNINFLISITEDETDEASKTTVSFLKAIKNELATQNDEYSNFIKKMFTRLSNPLNLTPEDCQKDKDYMQNFSVEHHQIVINTIKDFNKFKSAYKQYLEKVSKSLQAAAPQQTSPNLSNNDIPDYIPPRTPMAPLGECYTQYYDGLSVKKCY